MTDPEFVGLGGGYRSAAHVLPDNVPADFTTKDVAGLQGIRTEGLRSLIIAAEAVESNDMADSYVINVTQFIDEAESWWWSPAPGMFVPHQQTSTVQRVLMFAPLRPEMHHIDVRAWAYNDANNNNLAGGAISVFGSSLPAQEAIARAGRRLTSLGTGAWQIGAAISVPGGMPTPDVMGWVSNEDGADATTTALRAIVIGGLDTHEERIQEESQFDTGSVAAGSNDPLRGLAGASGYVWDAAFVRAIAAANTVDAARCSISLSNIGR